MTTLQVKNFIRATDATIELSPIALLIGNNGNGKSSVAMAAALAATGQKVPPGVLVGQAKTLVHDGAKGESSIALGNPLKEHEQKITYPGADVTTSGGPPTASPYAVGLASLLDMTLKERAAALGALIKSDPTEEDLKTAFAKAEIPASAVDFFWKIINATVNGGWDVAHKRAADKRAERKGEWKAAAGEDYGADKARAWQPEGFSEDLAGADKQELERAIGLTQGQLEDAIRAQGGKVADLQRLQDLAGALEQRQGFLAEKEEALQTAAAAMVDAEKARAALPAGGAETAAEPPTKPCAHCGAMNVIKVMGGGLAPDYVLEDPAKVTKPKMTKEVRQAIASVDGAVSRTKGARQDAQGAVGRASADLKASEEAKALLEEMARQPTPDSDAAEAAVNDAREAHETAKRRLALWTRWTEASKLHGLISTGDRVAAVLAPTGIRQTKLAESLSAFNDQILAPLSEAAGWPALTVQPDMTFIYDGRQVNVTTAKSFKARVRYLLAYACAKLDGSQIVVCDEADILDRETGRVGLLKLAKASGIDSLLCMTAWGAQVPNLANNPGWGTTYEIVNGVATAMEATS